jgi:hypothetical protein
LRAAPSFLDADMNMHGFRMTDHMDGVVKADFIDDQKSDYARRTGGADRDLNPRRASPKQPLYWQFHWSIP